MSNSQTLALPANARSVPRIDQYFGAWAVSPAWFNAAWSSLQNVDLASHIQANLDDETADFSQASYVVENGVAVIDIWGVMTKGGSSMSSAGSSIRIRDAVRRAARDQYISAIVLRIDSPGGTVAGTDDLADEIAAAAKLKTVVAYCEDCCASAAYFAASQATRVVANRSALVGCIGTYMVVCDSSKAAEQEGVKVHVVRAGDFKGAGVAGTEITDAHLAMFQQEVDDLNALFLAAVQRGRRLGASAVAKFADGRSYIAGQALTLGLIDAVQTFDEVMQSLSNQESDPMTATNRPAKNGNAAPRADKTPTEDEEELAAVAPEPDDEEGDGAETPAAPTARRTKAARPATLGELKATFPDSTADFREQCLESGMTLAQAKDARIEALAAEVADLKAKAGKPGVPTLAVGSAKGPTGDAETEWHSAIKEKTAAGMSKTAAVAAVSRENPELHKAFVEAVNNRKR